MIDIGADTSTNTSDIAATAAPMACSGTAVIAPTNAAAAPTVVKHASSVNITAQQPIARITAADVAAAAVANNAFGAPGPPGTVSKPAIAANPVASRPSVNPAGRSRNTRHAITAASRVRKPTVAATPALPVRRGSLVSNIVRINTAAVTPARQLATSAPISRAARRVQGRTVAASNTDTASAASSKRGADNSVDEPVRINVLPSLIPTWANVFDGSSAMLPGRES